MVTFLHPILARLVPLFSSLKGSEQTSQGRIVRTGVAVTEGGAAVVMQQVDLVPTNLT